MGVEVVGSEMAQVPIEAVSEVDSSFLHDKENGKLEKESGLSEPIKFGTHEQVPTQGEANDVADSNFPKDAVDEWPAPKQIHSFYFVRFRTYDDPKIKAKIDQADKEIQKRTQARIQLTEQLRAKRAERSELINQSRSLKSENNQYTAILQQKRKEMEPLQQALGKLRNSNGAARGGICSSEEELDDLIYSLKYRMQHESIPLTEEKQILREIKQLEGTREKVIANASMRAKIQDSLGQKEAIQDQVKLMGVDLTGVRKEQEAVWDKVMQLDKAIKALETEIDALQNELKIVTDKRDKAYESILELRKQRDDGNANFFQSRSLLNKARELAAKKDVKALEELSQTEVDKFMSLWCNNKAFRDDYEKRILPSLDSRQLSRDGRMRNPDEKPLVVVETQTATAPEPVAKASVKRPKEDPKSVPQKDNLPAQKVKKEGSKTESKTTSEHPELVEKEEIVELEKGEPSPAEKAVDEAKLKELKREEEIAKAKQAMERKKKLAEKAAAKAAIRAQKEAEKKQKEISSFSFFKLYKISLFC
ncbi:hypothetical protein Tsubulata_029708 [Turnera subulata]|uniref:Proton pump-interactor 1 n=1 Tax=Turnera subulata TaxID=218843 RepID=A0A9Q0JI43_9ROSI|nr:hypothetical protein Tsubulata_029708 [Turnera subulata]